MKAKSFSSKDELSYKPPQPSASTAAFDNQTTSPLFHPTKASQRAIPKQLMLLFPIPADIFLSRHLEL